MKKFVFRLAAISLGSALILSATEVALRLTHFAAPHQHTLINDTVVKGVPYSTFMNFKEQWNLVRYNNLGFHDHDREVSSSKYRYLFIGDSFLEGPQVPVESLYTSIAEKRLQSAGKPVELINAGLSGTGTAAHYLLWREVFAGRITHDHIILSMYIGNDLEDNSATLNAPLNNYAPSVDADGTVHVNRVGYSRTQKTVRFLTARSAVFNLVYDHLYQLRRQIARKANSTANPTDAVTPNDTSAAQSDRSKDWGEAVSGTLALIDKWHAEARQQGLRFSIFLLPSDSAGGDALNHQFNLEFMRKLEELCRAHDIKLLTFQDQGLSGVQLYAFDDGRTMGHFNNRGHDVAAQQVADWISGM